MSHLKERSEKICLNCSSAVTGRFCQNCGQENVEFRQSFWPMFQHFIYDIFHFEGKFMATLKDLLLHPGKVPKAYCTGKRTHYLDPIKMYLFLSAITFLLFPLILNINSAISKIHIAATTTERMAEASSHFDTFSLHPENPELKNKIQNLLDTSVILLFKDVRDTMQEGFLFHRGQEIYKAIPEKKEVVFPERNWFESKISRNLRRSYDKKGGDLNTIIGEKNNKVLKFLPYLLFLSLPVFAFTLKSMYKKRDAWFSEYAVFTLYHYIVAFLLLLVALLLSLLFKSLRWNYVLFVHLPILLLLGGYLILELKHFFAENWIRTISKFLVLSITTFMFLAVLYFGLVITVLSF